MSRLKEEAPVADWSQAEIDYTTSRLTTLRCRVCVEIGLEKFELSRRRFGRFAAFSPENPHSFELLVGDRKETDFAVRGKGVFHAANVNLCALLAGAVTQVYRELHL